MKYTFCTIAIGDRYLDSALTLSEKLLQIDENSHMIIVTDEDYENKSNVSFYKLPSTKKLFLKNFFNYNLKYYPIKLSVDMDFEFIIFIDSDWVIENNLTLKNLDSLFNYMEKNNFDFLFERPHKIGDGKRNDGCFWKHKLDFYKLNETDEFDDGHVVNEQFLVFKNSEKIKVFIKAWEDLEIKASEGNLWAFAEGVEIGMSMVKANLSYCFYNWFHHVKNCFSFRTKDNKYFKRF